MCESSKVVPTFITIGAQSRFLKGFNAHLEKDSKDAFGSHLYLSLFTFSWILYFSVASVNGKGIHIGSQEFK